MAGDPGGEDDAIDFQAAAKSPPMR